jgi:hypothetical protein
MLSLTGSLKVFVATAAQETTWFIPPRAGSLADAWNEVCVTGEPPAKITS